GIFPPTFLDLKDSTSQSQPSPPPPVSVQVLAPARISTDENPVFNLVDVFLIVLVALGSMIVCFAVTFAIYFTLHPWRGVDPKAVAYNAFLVIPVQVVSYILTVGFMVFIVWQRYRADFLQAVRWNMPTAKRAWAALAGGVGLAFASQL